jgi:hypothetical protein
MFPCDVTVGRQAVLVTVNIGTKLHNVWFQCARHIGTKLHNDTQPEGPERHNVPFGAFRLSVIE